MTDNRFYVYEHWRLDRDECFYVGKGRAFRAYDMKGGRNRHHKAITAKIAREGFAVDIRIIASGMSEIDALSLEEERIRFWRTEGADLANIKTGGQISTGYRATAETKQKLSRAAKGRTTWLGRKHRQESIEKMRKASTGKVGYWKGKKRSQHDIQSMKDGRGVPVRYWLGKTRSEDTKDKIRKAKVGCPPSEPTAKMTETRIANCRKAARDRQKKVICTDDGIIYHSLTAAASSYGTTKALISRVCRGGAKRANGFGFSFIVEN